MYIQPLIEGQYFHIFNRGINGENIFREECNYNYFLKQYDFYCSPVLDTFAYSLLKNHFHLSVFVKENVIAPRRNGEGIIRLNASKQLSHFFNSYSQSINAAYNRTGSLFESPFERKLVDNPEYFTSLIVYCHRNPQRHNFVPDFKQWEFSSYKSILKNDNRFLSVAHVLQWFGDTKAFISAHELNNIKQGFANYIINSVG